MESPSRRGILSDRETRWVQVRLAEAPLASEIGWSRQEVAPRGQRGPWGDFL